MRRCAYILLVLSLLFFAQTGFCQNIEGSVRFADLQGEVSVRPDSEDDDAYVLADLDMELNHDDRIKTGERSSAILSFSDMSTFVMKAETELVLDIKNKNQSKLALVTGNIWVNLKKMSQDGSMQIETSQAVAGIKGTATRISSTPGKTRIDVIRGVVSAITKNGDEIQIPEGFFAQFEDGKLPVLESYDEATGDALEEDFNKALANLGLNTEIDDIPERLKEYEDNTSKEMEKLSNIHRDYTTEKTEQRLVALFLLDAERYEGVIVEYIVTVTNYMLTVSTELKSKKADLDSLNNKEKKDEEDEEVIKQLEAEIKKLTDILTSGESLFNLLTDHLKTLKSYRTSTYNTEEAETKSELLAEYLDDATELSEFLSTAMTGGISQSEVADKYKEAAQLLEKLDRISIDTLTSAEDKKTYASLVAEITDLQKSFVVYSIESSVSKEIDDYKSDISTLNVAMTREYDDYRSGEAGATLREKERRMADSLKLMAQFSKIKRTYDKAQRLYTNTSKNFTGKIETSEQSSFKDSWNNIQDEFNALSLAASDLQDMVEDIQEQLNKAFSN